MTVIDYSARDYEAVREALISRIQDHLPEWRSRSPNDFGIVMLELFAYSCDLMNYYADRVANESFISTAVLDSSVLDIARMVGYQPRAMQAARAQVTFTFQPDWAYEIVIPAGFRLRTATADTRTAVYFSTLEAQTVPPGTATLANVEVIEGSPFDNEVIGTGTGGPGQTVIVPYNDLDTDSLVVTVGTMEWTQSVSLMNGQPTGRFYKVYMIPDGTWVILFGDGVNGAMPRPGELIRVSARRSMGSRGNVPPDAITEIVAPLMGVLAVTNSIGATGGEDRETVEQIRTTMPESLHAFERAVTLSDYNTLANLYPGIAKAQASAVVYTNVTVYIVAVGGSGIPTQSLRDDLQGYLTERSLVNVTVAVDLPMFVDIVVKVDVHRKPDINDDQIAETVKATLQDAINWTNPEINFNMVLTLSHIYQTIDSISDIEYCIVTAFYISHLTQTLNQSIAMDIGQFPRIEDVVVNFI